MAIQSLPPLPPSLTVQAEALCTEAAVSPLEITFVPAEESTPSALETFSFLQRFGSLSADFGRNLLKRAQFFGSAKNPVDSTETDCTSAIMASNSVNVSGSASFGDVYVGNSASRSFTISNPNGCPVNFYIAGAPYGFSLSTSSGRVPARGSTSVTITFRPPNDQSYNGSISVSPGGGSVSMSGRGIRR